MRLPSVHGWLLAWLVGMLAFVRLAAAAPSDTRADPSNTVAIAAPDEPDPIARGLAAELQSIGFGVAFIAAPRDADDWRALQSDIRRRGYAAAIWAVTEQGELTVWVVDRTTGKALVRSVDLPPVEVQQRDQLAVLQGIELLRASFRELEARRPPPAAEVEAPAPARKLAEPPPSRLFVELGGALVGASGGVGPSGHLSFGLRYTSRYRVGGTFKALAPTVGPLVRGSEGTSRLTVGQVVIGPHVALRRPGVRIAPDVALLGGLQAMRMDGTAQAPFVSRTDHVLGFVVRGEVGLSLFVAARVAFRLEAVAGSVVPAPAVYFAGREAARWGPIFGLGTVGLQVALD